jgi:cohesin complex subunit SCC1
MFYSTQILAKKGPLGTIWIAAHLDRRLKRAQVFETNITDSVGALRGEESASVFFFKRAFWMRLSFFGGAFHACARIALLGHTATRPARLSLVVLVPVCGVVVVVGAWKTLAGHVVSSPLPMLALAPLPSRRALSTLHLDSIINPEAPLALRLSGQLLLGVVKIYSRKVRGRRRRRTCSLDLDLDLLISLAFSSFLSPCQVGYLFQDCNDALVKIEQAFHPGDVDMPADGDTALIATITLGEGRESDNSSAYANAALAAAGAGLDPLLASLPGGRAGGLSLEALQASLSMGGGGGGTAMFSLTGGGDSSFLLAEDVSTLLPSSGALGGGGGYGGGTYATHRPSFGGGGSLLLDDDRFDAGGADAAAALGGEGPEALRAAPAGLGGGGAGGGLFGAPPPGATTPGSAGVAKPLGEDEVMEAPPDFGGGGDDDDSDDGGGGGFGGGWEEEGGAALPGVPLSPAAGLAASRGRRLKRPRLDIDPATRLPATQLAGSAIRALLVDSSPLLRDRGAEGLASLLAAAAAGGLGGGCAAAVSGLTLAAHAASRAARRGGGGGPGLLALPIFAPYMAAELFEAVVRGAPASVGGPAGARRGRVTGAEDGGGPLPPVPSSPSLGGGGGDAGALPPLQEYSDDDDGGGGAWGGGGESDEDDLGMVFPPGDAGGGPPPTPGVMGEAPSDDDEGGEDAAPPPDAATASQASFTRRTRFVLGRLQAEFRPAGAPPSAPPASVSLAALTAGAPRLEAARWFFETLVLKTRGFVDTEQAVAYGDIQISARTPALRKGVA